MAIAEVAGTVSFITGAVVAVDQDGSERVLALGDTVYLHETLRAEEGARVEISSVAGDRLVLEGGEELQISQVVAGADGTGGAEDAQPLLAATVTSIIGTAVAIAADGSERILSVGDPVFEGELVRVASGGRIELASSAGETVELVAGQEVLVAPEFHTEIARFDPSESVASSDSVAKALASVGEVDAIQSAILAGQDPTAIAEATAAGQAPGAGDTGPGDSGSRFVQLDRTGQEVSPQAGYRTSGLDRSLSTVGTEEQAVGVEPISLTNINDVPTGALNGRTNVDADVINLDVSSGFSDLDGDSLSFSATGLPPGLSISAAGVISGTIAASASDATDDNNNTQDYSVTVTASDGKGGSVEVDFTWTVNNTVPEFISGTDTADTGVNADVYDFSAAEGTTSGSTVGTVVAADKDGDTLSYSITGGNTSGLFSIDAATGAISVTQDIDDAQLGDYALTVSVDDSEGGSDSATANISLTSVNDVPTGALGSQTNVDADVINLDVSSGFTDLDGDSLSFSATGLPAGLSISAAGVISGTIAASASDATDNNNNTQDYSVTVTASDGKGGSVPVDFTWTVNNTVPEFISGTDTADTGANADVYDFSAAEGTTSGSTVGTVVAADKDGDTLSYSITGGNTSGLFSIDAATGAISVTQDIDDAQLGDYALTVTVDDSEGGSDTATANISLTNINDVPTGALNGQTNVDTDVINLDVSSGFTDLDGDSLSFSATGLPAGLSISAAGVISGTIEASASDATDNNNNTQDYSVTVTASDGKGGSVPVDFTWTVNNTVPEFISGTDTADTGANADVYDFSAAEGTTSGSTVGTVAAADKDGDSLSYSITGGNDAGLFSINATTGVISVTQDIDDAQLGDYALTVTVDDSEGGSDSATANISLTNINDVPTGALNGQTNVDADVINLDVSSGFTDLDGDSLSFSATGLPPGLSISAAGVISGTIEASASDATDNNDGTQDYSVTVTASDGKGGSVPVDFTWTVNNTVPEFISGTDTADTGANADVYDFSAAEGTTSGSAVGTVAAADKDGDSLSYSITGGNDAGLFSINATTGVISVTQDIDDAQLGDYALTVTVDDSEGGSDTATANISLTNINDVPTGALNGQTNVDADVINLDVSSGFTDLDGDSLSFSATGLPPGLSISAAGVISGTIEASASDATDNNDGTQDYSVTVTASDGKGGSVPVDFTWTVNNTVPEFISGTDTADTGVNADVYDFSAAEGTTSGSTVGIVVAADKDGDTLSYSITGGNDAGLFSINATTGAISVTQDIDDAQLGDYALTVTVDDSEGGSDSATANISLTNVNDVPTIQVDSSSKQVSEKGLPLGSGELADGDSDNQSDQSEIASGTFTLADSDGLDDIDSLGIGSSSYVRGVDFSNFADLVGKTIDVGYGTVELTAYNDGIFRYSYSLNDTVDNDSQAGATDAGYDESFTVSVSDGSESATAKITINIVDDGPSLSATNLAIANVTGSYAGTYAFDVGADTQSFADSFDASALQWTNARDGYSLEYDAAGSDASHLLYNAVYEEGAETFTFFTLQVNADGTYALTMVTPDPIIEQTIPSLLNGISGGSNLPSYTFGSSVFGGEFAIVVTGTENGAASTLTISSTDLGVGDNVMHGSKQDVLRFDVQPTASGSGVLSELTIQLSHTGGVKTDDEVKVNIRYTDGSVSGYSEQIGADYSVTVATDTVREVDYIELAPADAGVSFKITGLAGKYVTSEFPDDYELDFQLSGTDSDGDSASTNFSVMVNATDNGSALIEGQAGNDVIFGTASNDILTGHDGADIFVWSAGNEGGVGSGLFAEDTVTDFKPSEGDVLDLSDLLVGETEASLDAYLYLDDNGTDSTLYVSSDGSMAAADNATDAAARADQVINLTDLSGTDIDALIASGNLTVDNS